MQSEEEAASWRLRFLLPGEQQVDQRKLENRSDVSWPGMKVLIGISQPVKQGSVRAMVVSGVSQAESMMFLQ